MFSPFGRSVPSLKINLISCCLRLMLLPAHCFKPQTMMSSREWEAELKCSAFFRPGSATGYPGGGGGGGTPLFGLYGDVPLDRIWFFGLAVLNRVYNLTCLCPL